jgi:outer membrane receptor protein involved in Fe transport
MFKRVLALVIFCACIASAQEVTAGITGRVTDPSGATIAGATVKVRSVDRGTEWTNQSNGEGIYVYPSLPIGAFKVTVEAKGFKTFQTSLTLEVNQRARVDAQMEVGAITDSVTVSTETVALQADTTQVGSVIASRTISNMPLLSRNPIALTLLAAGVTTPDQTSMNSGTRTSGGGRPYVNGNREESNNFLLDGVDNNQVSDNLTSYQPNPDAIEEFKLITNNASAEFGNFQGGIVNVVIKSGTNQIHGTLFEQFRNDKLNADNWGRNWQGLTRTPLRWNQFGGTVGGPVFKDKLFFFADYQGLRQATPTSLSTASVMPMAFRSGDFSGLLGTLSSGKVIQLYNPNQVNTTTGARTPFTGNIIPAAQLSPVATALLQNTQLYPAPTGAGLTNNVTYSGASYVKTDQGDIKLDWRPTSKDYFSSRYTNSRQDQPSVNSFPLFYNSFNIAPMQNGVFAWTRTLSPTMVNEARVGVNNIMLDNGGADKGLGDIATKVGIQGAGSGLLSLGAGTNSGTAFAYASGIGSSNIGTMQLFANTTYHYADNFTLIKGRHMLKMGGQLLRQDLNTFYSGNGGRTGYMNFSGRFTAANAISPAGTQIGEADFMLGLPTDIGRGLSTGTWGHRGSIYGIYGQDDWRVSDSLTLNLGLRWEYHTPWVEVDNRQANFNLVTGQLEMAGQDGNSRALYNSFKKDFQPRLGFAYTPEALGKKVVIRGGYTISSFLEGTGTNLRLPLNPPLNAEYGQIYNTSSYLTPGSTLADGLSVLSPKDPYKGANLRVWSPDVRPAIVQQWNFTTLASTARTSWWRCLTSRSS